MRNRILIIQVVAVCALSLGVRLLAQSGDKAETLAVEVGRATGEAVFCEHYREWLAHRAGLDQFDRGWSKRLEQAKFATKEHLKYLDEQPFLSDTAVKYHTFLKDLDAVQDRVSRWNEAGAKKPDYAEAVASYLPKTIYSSGEALTAAELKSNYFARRLTADTGYPAAEAALDRKLLTESYDSYVAAWAMVPAPKIYDVYRADVLRKAVKAGRLAMLLGGDKADRSFPASINTDDAKHLLQVCATLRDLNPADEDGEIRAAAAVAHWAAGDAAGAYAESVPILAMRKTDTLFGVFCARLASTLGKSEDAMAWLQESARGGLHLMPSAALLKTNPDFADVRQTQGAAFERLLYSISSMETVQTILRVAKALGSNPEDLNLYKEMYQQIPMLADHREVRSRALCVIILGLRVNGVSTGVEEMQLRLESYTPKKALLDRIKAENLQDSCQTCNGSGIDLVKNLRCSYCQGSGVCKFEYCQKGRRVSPFDRSVGGKRPEVVDCGSCKGTSVCRYCKSKGKAFCTVCDATGKTISKEKTSAELLSLAKETAELAQKVLNGEN
jgi:hypothetical protein